MDKDILKLSPLTESTFYTLLVLKRPMHGYGIIKEVEELTKGRLVLAAGTLYGVLQNLNKHDLISFINDHHVNKRRKEYIITSTGNDLHKYEIKRLKEVIKIVKKVHFNEKSN